MSAVLPCAAALPAAKEQVEDVDCSPDEKPKNAAKSEKTGAEGEQTSKGRDDKGADRGSGKKDCKKTPPTEGEDEAGAERDKAATGRPAGWPPQRKESVVRNPLLAAHGFVPPKGEDFDGARKWAQTVLGVGSGEPATKKVRVAQAAIPADCPAPPAPCTLHIAQVPLPGGERRTLEVARFGDLEGMDAIRAIERLSADDAKKNLPALKQLFVDSSRYYSPRSLRVAVLGALESRPQDREVIDFLAEHGLKDEADVVRRRVIELMAKHMNGLIPASPKALGGLKENPDLREFVAKAPDVFAMMASGLRTLPEFMWGTQEIENAVNALNYMKAEQKLAFFKGVANAPGGGLDGVENLKRMVVIPVILDRSSVSERTGFHGDSADALYAAALPLLKGAKMNIGDVLAAFGDKPVLQAHVLSRLNQLNIMAKEFARDPQVAKHFPALMFGNPNADHGTVFSMFALASQGPQGKGFVDDLFNSMKSHPLEASAFLSLQKGKLTAAQAQEVDRVLEDYPRASRLLHQYKDYPAIYGHDRWLGNKMSFYVAITQKEHLSPLLSALASDGFKRVGGSGAKTEYEGTLGGKTVRYQIELFKSDAEGWAVKRDEVADAMHRCLSDDTNHGCIFRGHAADYLSKARPELFRGAAFNGKALVDGGCYSDGHEGIVMNCRGGADCRNTFLGSTRRTSGAANTPFIREFVRALAHRMDYPTMHAMFQQKLPHLMDGFTGPWSPARLWRAATRPEFNPG
ncbi:MAG: HEAT repeat domain-containing protein [Elusimicrobia bacterium]|nr:HEAT repeat domain-containing protein [Elusimicrobiota bacterium]